MRHVLEGRGMLHMPHRWAAAASTTERRRREDRLGGRSLNIQAFLFLNQIVVAAIIAAGRGAVYGTSMTVVAVADLDAVIGCHLSDA